VRLLGRKFDTYVLVHGNIILPVVLCGYEICWLTLKEERRLRVFENSLLRRKFDPRGDGVIREVEETT
jgi:hypothetical protein